MAVELPKTLVLAVLAPAAVRLRIEMVVALLLTRAPIQTTLFANEEKSPTVKF